MGTDIHVVAQVRNSQGVWEDIELIGEDIESRNYTWFTFLDGCRSWNTNTQREYNITPISEPRGVPEGFEQDIAEDGYDACYKDKWMGYGVSSWVTLKEILDHERLQVLPPSYGNCRIGPIDELEALFKGHDPNNCRIVFGYD